MQHIKNIIFDLGGVIINLDINQTIQEFNRLSYMSFEAIYTQAEQSDIFNKFDKVFALLDALWGGVLFTLVNKINLELNF
jgi:hypothetical protein